MQKSNLVIQLLRINLALEDFTYAPEPGSTPLTNGICGSSKSRSLILFLFFILTNL